VNEPRPTPPGQLDALRHGAPEAIDAIVDHWQKPLFAFAWRYLRNRADAEDVVIETFVRLHRHRRRLRADTNLAAWLFTALANLCHNRHRWRGRHPEENLDATDDTTSATAPLSPPSPRTSLESDEAERQIRSALDRLPHDQRTVVLLHHFERLSYREIAGIVGCSERGVETRLYRARQHLREMLAHLAAGLAPR
jgi:RNA polymerase sigma-70 factor (ECF subfamily)